MRELWDSWQREVTGTRKRREPTCSQPAGHSIPIDDVRKALATGRLILIGCTSLQSR